MGADYTIPFADEFLGSSVIYEEYKGDFARASQTAEAAVNKARGQSSPTLLAEALLGRGIVHVLQGEPSSALACFEECERLVPAHPVLRLRAATYSNLANHLQFNAFPDGRSSHSREIDARWDGVAYVKDHSPQRQALLQQIDDTAVELESKLVDELLVNTRVGRGFVDADRTHDLAMGARLLDTALSSPQAFERHAESVGASRELRAAAMLMAASLCWWGRDLKRARTYLFEAQQGYQQARDFAGEAVCEMNRGDWLAAPLSSPGLWNFLIKEGLDSSDLGWTIESLEFDSRLAGRGDIAEAQAAYAAAAHLFEDAGARRGLAALRLREGYLAALESDYASAVKHGGAALEHFEATGDLLGTQLARTHLLLGWVGLGRFPEDSKTAAAIGSWGQQQGSFSYALGLGLLLSRAGRYWLVRKGDYERALACFRLAEALFRALAATSNAAQSLVDQAMTYHTIGEPYAAAAAYERARDLYAKVPANVPALSGAFRWQTSKLEREIYSIYEKHRNADGMARCLARLEQLAAQPVPQMGWAEAESRFRVIRSHSSPRPSS